MPTAAPGRDAPVVTVMRGEASGPDGRFTLSLSDVDDPAGTLSLAATSSDAGIVAPGGIAPSGPPSSPALAIVTGARADGLATVVVSASDGTLTGQAAITVIAGGNGADMLSGLAGPDVLCGGRGDDVLDAGAGDDAVGGGQGADVLTGGPGADRFHGGPGADTVTDRSEGGVSAPDDRTRTGRLGRWVPG